MRQEVYFLGVLGRYDGARNGWEAFFEDGEKTTLLVPDADVMLVIPHPTSKPLNIPSLCGA